MRINRLGIKRYKNLYDVEMADISNLTVLIGENGSGKTNLLEAIQLFFDNFEVRAGQLRDIEDHYWFKKDTTKPIQFEFDLVLAPDELEDIFGKTFFQLIDESRVAEIKRLKIKRKLMGNGTWNTISLHMGNAIFVENDEVVHLLEIIPKLVSTLPWTLYRLNLEQKEEPAKEKLVLVNEDEKIGYWADDTFMNLVEDDLLPVREFLVPDLQKWAEKSSIEISTTDASLYSIGFKDVNKILRQLSDMISTSFSVIEAPCPSTSANPRFLIEQKDFQETKRIAVSRDFTDEESWTQLRNDFRDIFVNDPRKRLITKGNELVVDERGRTYPIWSMGSGHQSGLRIVKKLRNVSAIVALEEPEVHLHPRLCRKYLEYLKEKSVGIQFLVVTHSPIFIDQETQANNWVMERDEEKSHVYRIADFKKALEVVGASPSDRFMSESVLLVEGPSDEVFISACAEKMGIGSNKLLIFPIHGKGESRRNLDAWAPVVKGTQIRLLLVLDRDAKPTIERMVKRGVIDKNDYRLLKGEIEDLYPVDLIREVFTDVFKIDIEPMDNLGCPRKEHLKSLLEKEDVELDGWNVKLAEGIGDRIEKNRVPEDIASILERISQEP